MTTWQIDSPRQLSLDEDVTAVTVRLMQGRLRVVGTEGPPRVDVRAVGRRGLIVAIEDGVLTIAHEPKRWHHWAGPFWWFLIGRGRFHADVSVAVPPTCDASLRVISGSTVASGLRGGVTVELTSGNITLMGLTGGVRAKTVSGSIEALGVAGDLRVETISGEISLADAGAERVHARTISGSITCDLDNRHARDVRAVTTSGEITVRVPRDADLAVDLATTSGRVTSAFPQVRTESLPGRHHAEGRLGAGSGTLTAYAVSGSVSLLARPTEEFLEPDAAGSGGDQR
jgi:hypothetical protein